MKTPFLYKRLGYVAINVTDLQATTNFYVNSVGLDISKNIEGQCVSLRCTETATDIAIYQNEEAGLRKVGFQLNSTGDLALAYEHFASKSYSPESLSEGECDFLQIKEGFWLREPHTGLRFEFYSEMVEPPEVFSKRLADIQRVGHVVLRTPELAQGRAALEQDFGMVCSDFVEDKAAWFRCYPNPLHHSIALVKSETAGFHHVNFMVSSIDDIGGGRNRFLGSDVPIVYGPGRHMPSGSIFLYFHDPDKLTNEYSFGMEEFEAEGAREPRMLENSPKTMDLWGGLPSPGFCAYGHIDPADH